jgi:hypothetical protein
MKHVATFGRIEGEQRWLYLAKAQILLLPAVNITKD